MINLNEIEFKKMHVEDLNKISDILLTDFDDFWNYNIFKQELNNPNSQYICAIYKDEIIAFAGIWVCIDEAHITNIVTKKIFRNNGIGKLMLNNLISLCYNLKLKSITLEVNENNSVAILLYKNQHFEICGKRKKYYNYTDDAIIMTKILN